MKTIPLGTSGLSTTRLAYGCMRIAFGWDPDAVTAEDERKGRLAVEAAWDAGYRLFDHADIYCSRVCERIFGDVLKLHPEWRKDLVVATKCGIRFEGDPAGAPGRYDFAADHILKSCDASLKMLRVETIDVWQLHRPDLLMDPDEVAGAFVKLRQAGKVRTFGVSNFLPTQVVALQSALPFPLVVNQVEIHPGRLACFVDGTLDQCLERRMTPLAWSPLGGGAFGGTGKGDPGTQAETIAALDALAKTKGVTRAAITLAWLMKHPARIVPIVGSTDPARIREAAKADDVELTREEWYRVLLAARGEPLP